MTPTLIFWDETAWTEKGDKFWTAAKPTLGTCGGAIMVSTPSGLDAVFYKHFTAARQQENNFKAVELWWFNDPRYNKELCWLKNKGKQNEIKIVDENWDKYKRIQMMDDGWEASSPWFENQVKDANGDMRKIAQELLCSFLGSGDNFIAESFLRRIEENEIMTPIRQEYTDLNMWVFEDPLPEKHILWH
jgi:phage FluMu gp28-like protein